MTRSRSELERLYAPPQLLPEELAAAGDGDVDDLVFEPGPFLFISTPSEDWSDERLLAHVESLREALATSADPAFIVPNAHIAIDLLRERGIEVDLPLPAPLDPETVSAARKLIEGGLSPARAAKRLGISRATAYRITAEGCAERFPRPSRNSGHKDFVDINSR